MDCSPPGPPVRGLCSRTLNVITRVLKKVAEGDVSKEGYVTKEEESGRKILHCWLRNEGEAMNHECKEDGSRR